MWSGGQREPAQGGRSGEHLRRLVALCEHTSDRREECQVGHSRQRRHQGTAQDNQPSGGAGASVFQAGFEDALQ